MGNHNKTRKNFNVSEELYDKYIEIKLRFCAEKEIPEVTNAAFMEFMLNDLEEQLSENPRFTSLRKARQERENERTRREPYSDENFTLFEWMPDFPLIVENIPILKMRII